MADAVAMLAKFLRIDREEIHFNGLKDRRAITYQHVTWKCEEREDRELLVILSPMIVPL